MRSFLGRWRVALANEQGMSLVELSVAMTVGLLVMGAAYTMMSATDKGSTIVTARTQQTRDAAQSIDSLSRFLRETVDLVHAKDYAVQFTCDFDRDGQLEDLTYTAASNGELTRVVRNANSGVVESTRVIATGLRNNADSTPVFRYYRSLDQTAAADGSYSPPQDGDRLTKTTLIRITVVTRGEGSTEDYTQTTDVFLRNPQS